MQHRTMMGLSLLVLLALAIPRSALANDIVLGEWTDNIGSVWQQRIKIVKQGERYLRVSSFKGGSTQSAELREIRSPTGRGWAFRELEASDSYAIRRPIADSIGRSLVRLAIAHRPAPSGGVVGLCARMPW